jgi:NifB/MoaA-like Fe-S oxidoreductase
VLTRLAGIRGVEIHPLTIKNRFFGPSVTVAGLLTGSDLLKALKQRRKGNLLVIPAGMLKEDESVFLDNMTLKELEERLDMKIIPVATFRDLVKVIRSGGKN